MVHHMKLIIETKFPTNNFDKNNEDFWFGFEQEYTLVKDGRPLGFPKGWESRPSRIILLFSRSQKCKWKKNRRKTFKYLFRCGFTINWY